jgi:hypothetical protein
VCAEIGSPIASLDDIAVMKLAAVAQRGARKDFVDIYTLCREHRPLAQLLQLYKQRYGVADLGHVLAGLTYFVDAEAEPPLRSSRPISWRTVKADMVQWVRGLAR